MPQSEYAFCSPRKEFQLLSDISHLRVAPRRMHDIVVPTGLPGDGALGARLRSAASGAFAHSTRRVDFVRICCTGPAPPTPGKLVFGLGALLLQRRREVRLTRQRRLIDELVEAAGPGYSDTLLFQVDVMWPIGNHDAGEAGHEASVTRRIKLGKW